MNVTSGFASPAEGVPDGVAHANAYRQVVHRDAHGYADRNAGGDARVEVHEVV